MKSNNYASLVLVGKALQKKNEEVRFEWCHLEFVKTLSYLGDGEDPLLKVDKSDLDDLNFKIKYCSRKKRVLVRCVDSRNVWEYVFPVNQKKGEWEEAHIRLSLKSVASKW